MEYLLTRGAESIGKYGVEYVRYEAQAIHEDGEEQYLGHLFIPVQSEKTILYELFAKAPRTKLTISVE